ncbi:MAG: cyclic pyranopterin monophosphate synthase MoaC, partial [Desulfobacterales bacterium]
MSSFTHIDEKGHVRMVDVTEKKPTVRAAVAGGIVIMKPETLGMINNQTVKKGNVLETARIAGIMAAKKTSELIPMCHPLSLTHVQVDFEPDEINSRICIKASVRTIDQTGVEME